jgi:hypothetical protein
MILRTSNERDLEQILTPEVQAVVYTPPAQPRWLEQLAVAVERGAFVVARTVLSRQRRDEIAWWLDENLPRAVVSEKVRESLIADVLSLTDRMNTAIGNGRFRLCIFTSAPTTASGFHVDIAPPGAPAWGLLRVYNGAGTAYVQPTNLIGTREFKSFVSRRGRLARQRRKARRDGDGDRVAQLSREIEHLDRARPFLRRPEEIQVAPAGTIVAFKLLDTSLQRLDPDPALAWIHCSPDEGLPQLVVNVTAPGPFPPMPPQWSGAKAP